MNSNSVSQHGNFFHKHFHPRANNSSGTKCIPELARLEVRGFFPTAFSMENTFGDAMPISSVFSPSQ